MKRLIIISLISLASMQMQAVKPMSKEEIEKKIEQRDTELLELTNTIFNLPKKYDELSERIKTLVDEGAHIVTNRSYYLQPLTLSVFRPDAVKYLLEHGKDVRSENAQTGLNQALGRANINFLKNPKLDSPLLQSIKILLKHGATVDKDTQHTLMVFLKEYSQPQFISGLVILLPLLDPKIFYLANELNTSYMNVLPADIKNLTSAVIAGSLNLHQTCKGKTLIDLLKDLVQQYPNLPDTPKLQKMIEILEKKKNAM